MSIESVSSSDCIPIIIGDSRRIQGSAGTAPAPVILQSAVDIIRVSHIDTDLVDLGQGHVLNRMPAFSSIIRDVDASVIPVNKVERIGRVYPESMVVWMGSPGYRFKPLSHILRNKSPPRKNIDNLVITGVYPNLTVIERPEIHTFISPVITCPRPGFAFILRTPDAPILMLDKSVDNVGITPGNINSDPSHDSFRQIFGQLFPGFSAIRCFIKPASGAAARKIIRETPVIIGSRVEDLTI
ncbi:hypothetical protein ES703_94015 [subsurface metagenome]